MKDYVDLGLNKNLQAINSPLRRGNYVDNISFDSNYDVQAKNLRSSNLSVDNLIKLSGVATAAGEIDPTDGVAITSTLTPQTQAGGTAKTIDRRLFGNCYFSVYQGTAVDADYQIYPDRGGSIAYDAYEVRSGYDESADENINEIFQVNIVNNTAGTVNIYARARWKYIENRTGGASA